MHKLNKILTNCKKVFLHFSIERGAFQIAFPRWSVGTSPFYNLFKDFICKYFIVFVFILLLSNINTLKASELEIGLRPVFFFPRGELAKELNSGSGIYIESSYNLAKRFFISGRLGWINLLGKKNYQLHFRLIPVEMLLGLRFGKREEQIDLPFLKVKF